MTKYGIMKNLVFVLVAFASLIYVGCDKDEENIPAPEGLLSMVLNNQDWLSQRAQCRMEDGMIMIHAEKNATILDIIIQDTVVGDYVAKDGATDVTFRLTNEQTGLQSKFLSDQSMEIKVRDINRAQQYISGTFSGTINLYRDNGLGSVDTVPTIIENGGFNKIWLRPN